MLQTPASRCLSLSLETAKVPGRVSRDVKLVQLGKSGDTNRFL